MATKDITDVQVCAAVKLADDNGYRHMALSILERTTGQSPKVCLRAAERANRRGLIAFRTMIQHAWVTPEGLYLLRDAEREANRAGADGNP